MGLGKWSRVPILQKSGIYINCVDQMSPWMFWTELNFKDLLAWTKCDRRRFGQDQMSSKGDNFHPIIQGPYCNPLSQHPILFLHRTFHNVKLHVSWTEDGPVGKISSVNNSSWFAWDFSGIDTDSSKYWEMSQYWWNQGGWSHKGINKLQKFPHWCHTTRCSLNKWSELSPRR